MSQQNAKEVVDQYFRAMQAGQSAEAELFALFADDAVYVEPFSGDVRTHEGKDAICATLHASWEFAPPDLVLTVNRVDVDGDEVVSEWTCESPAFEAPVRGRDRCVVREGRIARLEVSFLNQGAA